MQHAAQGDKKYGKYEREVKRQNKDMTHNERQMETMRIFQKDKIHEFLDTGSTV